MSKDYIFEPRPVFSSYTPNLFLGSYYIEDDFQADPSMWADPLEDAFVTNSGMKEGKNEDGPEYLNDFAAETVLIGTDELDSLEVIPQAYFWKWDNYDSHLQIPTEISEDNFEFSAYERFLECAAGYDSDDDPYFLLVVDSFMDEGEDVDLWAEEADWTRIQTTKRWWEIYDLWMDHEGVEFLLDKADDDYDWAMSNAGDLQMIGWEMPLPDDDDFYWSMRQAENESHWMTFGRVDYNWATDPDDVELTDEEFWEIDEHIRNEVRYEIDTNNLPGESNISTSDISLSLTEEDEDDFTIYYYWGPAETTGVNSAESFEADDDNFADIEKLLDSDEDVFLGTWDSDFKPDHPHRKRIIEYLTQGGGGQTPYRVCFTCSLVTSDWVTIDEGYECIPCAESEDDDPTNCEVCGVKISYDEAIYWENFKLCEECYEVQMIRDIQNYTEDETDCISCGYSISPNDVLVELVDGLCPDCKDTESFSADTIRSVPLDEYEDTYGMSYEELLESYSNLSVDDYKKCLRLGHHFRGSHGWNPVTGDGVESFGAENQDMMCCGEPMEFYEAVDGSPDYFYCPVCEVSIITKEFDAESFEAPYTGAGSLMGITGDTDLSSFTSKELTESSAIHGDFDQASLNYSGHQNLEVRAESSAYADDAEMKKFYKMMKSLNKLDEVECDLCPWKGELGPDYDRHLAYNCPGTSSIRKQSIELYELLEREGIDALTPAQQRAVLPAHHFRAEAVWDDSDGFDYEAAWENVFEAWMEEWIIGGATRTDILKIYAAKNGFWDYEDVDVTKATAWYKGLTIADREDEIMAGDPFNLVGLSSTDSGELQKKVALFESLNEIIEDRMDSWDDQFQSENDYFFKKYGGIYEDGRPCPVCALNNMAENACGTPGNDMCNDCCSKSGGCTNCPVYCPACGNEDVYNLNGLEFSCGKCHYLWNI